MSDKPYKIGIMAYGSLIDDPGDEISRQEFTRLKFQTPFKVEYARLSRKRGNGPTLIPVEEGGGQVTGYVLVLNKEVTFSQAQDMLYNREIGKSGEIYEHSDSPSENKVQIKTYDRHEQVETILYTCIGCNFKETLTAAFLAENAINSARTQDGSNGIQYLHKAMKNGIITPLTKDYEAAIMERSLCGSLTEAIKKYKQERLSNT